ncbi:MAG TPA: alpha/beta hydrolase [Cytophagales bacterium]|nr:alpha/beta hydrolase [Cytophagales bacterium]HRG07741.1 alpha/beta fold hydrolase [Cyclobacteriaceae bacterium]
MKSVVLSFLFISVLLSACNSDDEQNIIQDLRLRHKGADMPIWVRGNIASGKLILYLHGGPGDCAMCYRHYFKELENSYGLAYWDQRIAGSSSGVTDVNTLTYTQFLEDTELVIDLLRKQYPNVDIYLMGHSFGVELGWQYLAKPANQVKVNGFMAVNGIYSSYRWLHNMREWVLARATELNDADAKNFVLENPLEQESILSYPWLELYRHMYRLDGNPVSLYSDASFVSNYIFFSPNLTFAQFTHGKHYGNVTETDGLVFEKADDLQNITIPVALFWGEKDGVVPVALAYETRDLLTQTSVELVLFNGSWHEPFVTENKKFIEAMRVFMDQY